MIWLVYCRTEIYALVGNEAAKGTSREEKNLQRKKQKITNLNVYISQPPAGVPPDGCRRVFWSRSRCKG